ncbi:MAG: lactate utilization protein B [Rhodospirillales bacterium]|nr:lactate utilization protein B [Rhodospirillales bacterium]
MFDGREIAQFPEASARALEDENLQAALRLLGDGFQARRTDAVERFSEFEDARDAAVDAKTRTLRQLHHHLENFEARCQEQGGVVHWAETPADARQIVLELLTSRGVRVLSKGKTMVAEEIGLNGFLEEHDIEVVETDLGEYIIQLADEVPSHIIAPAIHKTMPQVVELFRQHHHHKAEPFPRHTPADLVAEARAVLRRRFLEADAGLTGANFLVADTGSSVIVTNEGNGDLTQTLPRLHIVLATIEKVVPTLADGAAILRVLARSATGQDMSAYTTVSTGPRRSTDIDGPSEYHVILLDNGRSSLLGTPAEDVLRCIRCGACMNHCPVYGAVGGHAYGWVYPGPIGAALTPALLGVEAARHLPNASSLCGRCEEVCPMRIPLPKIFRYWRAKEHEARLNTVRTRVALALWGWLAAHPRLYRLGTGVAMWMLSRLAGRSRRYRNLVLANGWTRSRDFPAPAGRTFLNSWKRRS